MPCLIRAPCASCALRTRVLGLETTVRALALALALCVPAARQLHCTCGSADARMIPCRSYRRCLCLVSCCANYSRPLVNYFRPVLTTRRRHSRGSSPFLCVHKFLCLCFDLDFTCPYQSTSSLHRGQRRAEQLSYLPAGLEGSSRWLVFACYARGRHRCASFFALTPSPALQKFPGPLRRAYLPN